MCTVHRVPPTEPSLPFSSAAHVTRSALHKLARARERAPGRDASLDRSSLPHFQPIRGNRREMRGIFPLIPDALFPVARGRWMRGHPWSNITGLLRPGKRAKRPSALRHGVLLLLFAFSALDSLWVDWSERVPLSLAAWHLVYRFLPSTLWEAGGLEISPIVCVCGGGGGILSSS